MSINQAAQPALESALLTIKGLSKRYVRSQPFSRKKFAVDALLDVDLEIRPGCITALVGESGSGKSTLGACLALLVRPDRGEIWFEGRDVAHCTADALAALRSKIQLVFQDSVGALNPRFTLAEIIEEPLEIQGLAAGRERRQLACELMEEVGLSANWSSRSPLQLSGGQRQRIAIARALVLRPSLLILDESLSGLDLVTQSQILNLLSQLQRAHSLTYLLISHDLSLIAQVADFVAVMQAGKIVEYGERERIIGSPTHDYTQQLVTIAKALESGFGHLLESRA